MRTKTITLYKFNELSDGAQARAIEEWRNADQGPPAHNDEMNDTIEAFANVFPVSVRRWCYGGDRNDGVDFSMTCNDDVEELKGVRLATYIWNNYKGQLFKGKYRSIETSDKKLEHNRVTTSYYENTGLYNNAYRSKIFLEHSCVLTGVCFDEDILEPVYEFLDKPDENVSFKELMSDCFDQWVKAGNANVEYENSDEAIIETLLLNDYEFDEEGNIQ